MDSEFGADSIITGRGLGIGGFGGGYGYGQGAGSFAGPSANAIRIQEGNRQTASGIENLLDQNQFSATNRSINNSCNRVTDAQINGEFRTSDRMRDIEREMNANAREAASCCCDTKLESCKQFASLELQGANNKAEILSAIAASTAVTLAAEGRAVERDRNTLQAELISLKTQVACNCNCPS